MTERDVDGAITALGQALEDDDEVSGIAAGLILVGSFLKDVGRIADALEELARVARGSKSS